MKRALWSAAILWLTLTACSGQNSGDTAAEEEPAPAVPVEIAPPTRGDIYAVYTGTAPIEAFRDAQVIAKVAGEIQEILVEEGDDVAEGQMLARLDGDRLRLEAARIEADLQKLKRDFQRNVDLREKSLISADDFDKIQYELEALEASYDLAMLELGYTEIRAPIDGVISERFVKTGNTVEVNSPLFEVTSLEPLVSYLHVPEREYRRLEPGQTTEIEVDALQGERFTGTVARVSPVVDPETGTFKITIEVSDPTRRLKPGMFGRARIVFDRHADALQIPRNAIVEDGASKSVFVVDGDSAARRVVRTGYSQDGRVEVLDGLADDDLVIVVGQTGLKDGSRITVINAAEAELPSADAQAMSKE